VVAGREGQDQKKETANKVPRICACSFKVIEPH
jgi:hypothetical protein